MDVRDWLTIGCVLLLAAVYYAGHRGWIVRAPPKGRIFCPACGGTGHLPCDGVSGPRSHHT